MASTDSSNGSRWLGKAAAWIHGNFLWLLVMSYMLAAVAPGPGLAIRRLAFTRSTGDEISAPLLLLALLLFCAAVVVRWSLMRDLLQRPGILLLSLLAVWIVPSAFVCLTGWLLPAILGTHVSAGMMIGLALVAAMPVANSSVAWTQNARGNVSLGLGLIVLTIVLSPVATPQMLNLMGLTLSEAETRHCEILVTRFSGMFFIIWVILPSAAGLVCNRVVGPGRIERARGSIRLVSAVALLTLNYANASLAMPKVLESESVQTILFFAMMAVSLSLLGIASARLMSRILSLDRGSSISLAFGLSMKHTGLALVLAGEVLQDEPRAILMIVLATLLQHVVAGIVDKWLARNGPENPEAGQRS
ncbi:MAG: bile acid:sodium symporter [Planctomycetes bacterium]|nr:bile acid:sodium symporter [Planctomycetota bacterium]